MPTIRRTLPAIDDIPIAASTTITKNTGVCVNSSGFAVPAADTAGLKTFGFARETVDNSAGSAGDERVSCERFIRVRLTGSSLAQDLVGTVVYWAGPATVAPAGSVTNEIAAGKLIEYVSATEGVVEILGPGSDIPDLTVGTTDIVADAITGAKIADDAVDSEHIAAGAVDNEHMAANSIDSDQYVDGSIDLVHIAPATVDGTVAAVVADDNVIGGLPVIHRVDVADAASSFSEVTLTHKTRVIDVWVVKTGADGHETEDTIVVGNGANAITDAMAIGLPNDTGITRAAQINDANHEIAAAGALRVTWVKGSGGGNNTACIVYVLGIRVA